MNRTARHTFIAFTAALVRSVGRDIATFSLQVVQERQHP